jgi:murein DD-endopeptidase MepM/ murein hydrolase activator NlpD
MMYKLRTGISFVLALVFLFFSPPRIQTENFIHTIAPGDTLWSIARQYGVGVAALQSINNISDPSRLFVGQNLVIPRSYTVRPGDTLFGIARTHNLSLTELLQLNNRREDQVLRVGEVLIVAGSAPGQTSQGTQSTRPVGNQHSTSQPTGTTTATPGGTTTTGTTTPAGTNQPSTQNQTTTITLDTRTSVTVTPPRTAGTLLSNTLARDGGGTTWPVEGERYEFSGKFPGIAIVASRGTPVQSVTHGRVIYSGPHSTLGQVVFVQHPRGFVFIYGGNETLSVRTGDEVQPGTEIGTLGVTSAVQRAQVFFSVWKDGNYIDPREAPR